MKAVNEQAIFLRQGDEVRESKLEISPVICDNNFEHLAPGSKLPISEAMEEKCCFTYWNSKLLIITYHAAKFDEASKDDNAQCERC